jgi:cystathionine beta-synthase
VAGAVKYARQRGEKLNIVVLLPDGAAKYLSKIFNDEWMREHGFLLDEGLGTVGELLKHKPPSEIICARADDRVRDVIQTLKDHGISQIPVLKDGKLVGIVSEVSLLRHLASGEQSVSGAVEELVESDYATVSQNTSIEQVQALLADARMALVMDGDRIVGVVTKIDVIEYLARRRTRVSIPPPAG